MDFLKYSALWLPLIFAASLFAVDKAFLLPEVRRLTEHWSRFEDFFYSSRERMFRLYVTENGPAKVHANTGAKSGANTSVNAGGAGLRDAVLIYGSSRSAPFPVESFAADYPGALVYNFSAPSAAPSYYHYWNTRRREAAPARIRLALVELDAGLLTREALQPSLAYSYDARFIWRHIDWHGGGAGFSLENVETFLARRSFALLKYPLVVGHIVENQRELRYIDEAGQAVVTNQLAVKDRLFAMMDASFESLRGGVPYPVPRTSRPEELAAHAQATARRYREHAPTRAAQLYFLRSLLDELAGEGAPILIYRPVVAGALRPHLLGTVTERALIDAELRVVRERHPKLRIRLVDLNDSPDLQCREFSDSYHLAGRCYPALTHELLKAFKRP